MFMSLARNQIKNWRLLVYSGSEVNPEVNVQKEKFVIKLKFPEHEEVSDLEVGLSSVRRFWYFKSLARYTYKQTEPFGSAVDVMLYYSLYFFRKDSILNGWQHFVWLPKANQWRTVLMIQKFMALKLSCRCNGIKITSKIRPLREV